LWPLQFIYKKVFGLTLEFRKSDVSETRVFDTLTICTIPSRSEAYLFVAKLVSQLKSHIVRQ
jgi:hypothetical protein